MPDPHHTNRLARETSPYLLQHAHNPVDWYAWGPEAFDAARNQNKPIFLSVGYSTCYWCHVMERQSFENEHIAAEMNQRFINIKVDRQERPDVDQLYMTAVQVLTRHGGWPMSVFLTPDLKPFYGGTYFPPTDTQGRPGFVTVIKAIEDAYKNRRSDVEKSADQLVSILQQLARPKPPDDAVTIDENFIDQLVGYSTTDYDRLHAGFGHAPKFPRQTLLELLLVHNHYHPNAQRMKMVQHTLDAMAAGGIHDHLGGAFHRYSTDAQWLVPHFEIMLYDNAMLAWIYAEAYRQTEEQRYAHTARGILYFILREMTSPDGAFYTAFDAEVDAMEGASYLWTKDEIEEILGPSDAALFNRIYGVDQGPNFADPHHGTGRPDKNILYLPDPSVDAEAEAKLVPMREKLYAARRQRKQPLLDTKIITSWNALTIRAFAHCGSVLNENRYTRAASRCAEFLLRHHRTPEGKLYRTSRDGAAKYAAFLDDYTFLIQALLTLGNSAGKEQWKDHAASLAIQMIQEFSDDDDTGALYFTAKNAPDLIVRQTVGSDSPLPSGNAVAAICLLELKQPDHARKIIEDFAGQLSSNSESMSTLLQAALLYAQQIGPIQVAAAQTSEVDRTLSPEQLAQGIVSVSSEWLTPRQLELRLDILRGFHLNAHQPTENLIPTTISIDNETDARIDYPAGEEQSFAFSDQPIRVYTGHVSFAIHFKHDRQKSGKVNLTLRYQACDEGTCLPSVTRHVTVG